MRALFIATIAACGLMGTPLMAGAQSSRCLDYKSVGMSGCNENTYVETQKQKRQQQQNQQAQQTLENLPPAQRQALEMMIQQEVDKRLSTERQQMAAEKEQEELRRTREVLQRLEQQKQTPPNQQELDAAVAKEKELDEKISQFYARHDKPPEEFVRFYYEPTLENAIAWAKRNQMEQERSMRLSKAMTQARALLEEYEKTGQLPPGVSPQDLQVEDLPQVPDFNALLRDKDRPPLRQDETAEKPAAPLANLNQNRYITLPGQSTGQVDQTGRLQVNVPVIEVDEDNTGAASQGDELIRISYYFSAQCPFCRRFEPGFANVLDELGDKAQVTCVDMTPERKAPQNLSGRIDCQWRALEEGEMTAFGVEATPTLIINRGKGKPLERLSGHVEEGRLRRLLIGGENM